MQALQVHSQMDLSPDVWSMMKDQGAYLVRSGFLPRDVNTPEKAVVIMLKGRELGIPAMHAFAHIHVINGKPTISAELMQSLIYRHCPKAKIEFLKLDNHDCTIKATRPGHAPLEVSFTVQDAERAKLSSKDVWKSYPRAMCRARAISEVARSLFPDCLMGCSYTPEEMGAEVDEDGHIIDVAPAAPLAPTAFDYPPLEAPPPKPPSERVLSKAGYDGSVKQANALKVILKARNIPDILWAEIDERMLGKPFLKSALNPVISEVQADYAKQQPQTQPNIME